jgi:DNA-binding NarL/FixJ family response regulator
MSSARNTLQQFERERIKSHPAAKLLWGAVHALYVHLETGAYETEVANALIALRKGGFTGYARMFDALPLPSQAGTSPFGSLTKMEMAILRALALGNSSKGIGLEMERSALTIDTHVKAIVRKLGCKGRREAVTLAREHGIL